MSEFDFLEEQSVSAALIKAADEFRQGIWCFRGSEAQTDKAGTAILWEGNTGDGHGSGAGAGESASGRTEGYRKECAGRESGIYFRETGV